MDAKRLQSKLSQLEARATSITSQLSGMPRGGGADRDAVLASLADVCEEYYAMLTHAEETELEVLKFIDSLSKTNYRMILKLRYIECKRWPRVLADLKSAGLDIEERHLFRLHGEALKEAREKFKEWNL
jgi:hypothetical protein